MKNYTDIEQSRKLSEILLIESADMRYDEYTSHINGTPKVGYKEGITEGIPCWSLAALLDVLPKGINISTPKPTNELSYCCWNQYNEIYADNPVDACVLMILDLHKNNML